MNSGDLREVVSILEEQKNARRTRLASALKETSIPVPNELLEELTTLFITDVIHVLKHHPGFQLEEKIRSVRTTLRLFDAAHAHHARAMDWLRENIRHGWASCPLTQNGCVRILAQAKYPNCVPAVQAAARLERV